MKLHNWAKRPGRMLVEMRPYVAAGRVAVPHGETTGYCDSPRQQVLRRLKQFFFAFVEQRTVPRSCLCIRCGALYVGYGPSFNSPAGHL